MVRTPCIALIGNTEDIKRPLAYLFRSCLRAQVVELDLTEAGSGLERLAAEHKVFVIPVNELALNHVSGWLAGHSPPSEYLIMPGTAYLGGRTVHPVELSDKGALQGLLAGLEFNHFKTVESVLFTPADTTAFAELVQSLPLPVVIKPSTKDDEDGFTRLFPEKLLAIYASTQVNDVCEQLRCRFPHAVFILQVAIQGEPVSWFGAAKDGRILCEHAILSEVKSPVSGYGGTTTLARSASVPSDLADAASELVEKLRLDGFFEIEFIRNQDGLYFFHEINPRPILQAALIASEEENPFLGYLREQGVEIIGCNPLAPVACWGSAMRYLTLNRNTRLNWRVLMRHLIHDTRFGPYYGLTEKLRYMGSVVLHIIRRVP